MGFWIFLAIVAVVALWAIAVYNGLVSGRNQAQTAWSQIDVQLKRRHDLIPNLVQVVKDASPPAAARRRRGRPRLR
jgi:LemA protein